VSDERPALAVLGGSFNPPHLGHAMLPGYLLARADATRVLVAPCYDHPLGKSLAPFERRMSWVRAAMGPYDARVEVSRIEAELAGERDGPSYTFDLLEAIAAREPGVRVRLVVGSDITRSGETDRWHRWDDIVARFDPIIVPRDGWAEPGAAALPEVSSTVVREQLAVIRAGGVGLELARAALRRAVPAAVADALERWIAGDEPRVWIVGHGHVASHVVPWLRDRGFVVDQIGARALLDDSANVVGLPAPEGVWLLCRDDALEQVDAALVGQLAATTPVLHAAGARVARLALPALHAAGHPVGTLHPICSLRRERTHSRVRGASFGLEGHVNARRFGASLIGDAPHLDLDHLDPRGRLAYHAACALVANHMAVLEERGVATLRGLGLATRETIVERALGELMLGSLENLLALGIPAGITGPLSRGDRATVDAHLAALDDDATRSLYALLSERLASLI
jgi:nicotinate-nucleotide adenylyltransferase